MTHTIITKLTFCLLLTAICAISGCNSKTQDNTQDKVTDKPTLIVLGGTPSTTDILNHIPDSITQSFNTVTFNRPGFGGTENAEFSAEKIYQLARQAGIKQGDYGVIGISGGAPFALLLAAEFGIEKIGIISGMVPNKPYFEFAELTFTKSVMESATGSYAAFEASALEFPNIDEIVRQSGSTSKEEAIRASFNELNFILSDEMQSLLTNKDLPLVWWHGENDKNIALQSVELFLQDYSNAELHIVQDADHSMDARVYMEKIVKQWQSTDTR